MRPRAEAAIRVRALPRAAVAVGAVGHLGEHALVASKPLPERIVAPEATTSQD